MGHSAGMLRSLMVSQTGGQEPNSSLCIRHRFRKLSLTPPGASGLSSTIHSFLPSRALGPAVRPGLSSVLVVISCLVEETDINNQSGQHQSTLKIKQDDVIGSITLDGLIRGGLSEEVTLEPELRELPWRPVESV